MKKLVHQLVNVVRNDGHGFKCCESTNMFIEIMGVILVTTVLKVGSMVLFLPRSDDGAYRETPNI